MFYEVYHKQKPLQTNKKHFEIKYFGIFVYLTDNKHLISQLFNFSQIDGFKN